ncbi:MAG TPA: bifunctional DNA primase/polymerase [Kofleriaceae bacterium]|jgi:hypothetical protein
MTMLDAAFGYVDRSGPWPLFPADAKTKRPIIKTGRDHAEHASTDIEQIREWHRLGLLQAFGMPTGAASGTVVIDADKKHDGETLLAELEADLGPLPRTKIVRTQSGGLHVYLAHPGGVRVRTGAGADSALGRLLGGRAGVDVRADGGIVILPPSCGYVWIADDDEPLPPLPPLWLAAIQGAGDEPAKPRPIRSVGSPSRRWTEPERCKAVYEGGRNDALFDRGVALHIAGATDSEMLDDLLRMNAACCHPPVNEREVAKIAASAARATGRVA